MYYLAQVQGHDVEEFLLILLVYFTLLTYANILCQVTEIEKQIGKLNNLLKKLQV